MQYTYIHKSSQTNWLINVNYPILQKSFDKNKRKRKQKKVKQLCDVSQKQLHKTNLKNTSGINDKDSLLVSIS